MDEHGFVFDFLLQRHRDTEAAKIFLKRLLGDQDVPEIVHTHQLQSYGAVIREIPSLINVDHQQVISTARRNHIIEQRASAAGGAVLPKTITGVQAEETCTEIPPPARPDRDPPPSLPDQRFCNDQKK